LAFTRFSKIDEYSVSDVNPGESFTADCNFAWSLWKKPTDGFFLMGAGIAREPQLGIPFIFRDGLPSPMPGVGVPAQVTSDFSGYSSSMITAIDGYFIVLYKWPLCWFQEKRTIHMIARRSDDTLKWRIAPDSEPIIPDANGGFMVEVTGPPNQWGVTMKRAIPP